LGTLSAACLGGLVIRVCVSYAIHISSLLSKKINRNEEKEEAKKQKRKAETKRKERNRKVGNKVIGMRVI